MEAFEALGDPVRRAILLHLRSGPARAGDIASRFDLSRPAISRHLRVLRGSGLVDVTPVGRERLYALNPVAIHSARVWIDALIVDATPEASPLKASLLDESHLDALATEVARARRDNRGAAAKNTQHEIRETA